MSLRISIAAMLLGIQFACCANAVGEGPLRKRWMSRDSSSVSDRSSLAAIPRPGAKVFDGTKNALAGARERMAFWKKKESRASNDFVEGTGRFFRPDLARQERERERKPFSFVRPASWFKSQPEPAAPPQSVHDWIGQDRPGFEN